MKTWNVDSAKFLLERRFNGMGYGKSSQIDMKAQTQNLNLNMDMGMTAEEADKIRREILSRLSPKPLQEGF